MNLTIGNYNQNFQAKIKMRRPNLKTLVQGAAGTSATIAGAGIAASQKSVPSNTVQDSALNSGYIASVAASTYSAVNGQNLNEMLPKESALNPEALSGARVMSGLSSAVATLPYPFVTASDLSDTKSSQILSEAVSKPHADKKIPS